MLAAIEVYNKPTFEYRNETFAILAINAWELLLKARFLHLKRNVISSLYVPRSGSTQQGARNSATRYKKTRSGANFTIELRSLIKLFAPPLCDPLPSAVQENIAGLVEVRDVSVHLAMPGPELRKRTMEFAAASVSNFVELGRAWFGHVFKDRGVYMLPVGLIDPQEHLSGAVTSGDEKLLLQHLKKLASEASGANGPLAVAIPLEVKLVRTAGPGVASVNPSASPNSPTIVLEEKDLLALYKWDYKKLTAKLKQRYTDFVENNAYHQIRKPLCADRRFVHPRLLDPGNPRSARKDFYHPVILEVFDRHYTRRKSD